MPESITELSIFVASPGDVSKERKALDSVVAEINRTVGAAEEFRLVLKKWETHARPAAGRAQAVINQQLGPSDIFVGIMWKRFGTPTGKAGSGTEEEFDVAYAQWKRKRTRKPEIMFYFRESKFYPKTAAETRQFAAVQAFREKVQAKALTWTYPSTARFSDVVRPHLVEAARAVMARTPARRRSASTAPAKRSAGGPKSETATGSGSPVAKKRAKRKAPPKHRLPKVRRRLNDADRSRYLSRGFTLVKRYFREATDDINTHVPGARASCREREDGSLFVEVTSGGHVLNRAHITKSDEAGYTRGLSFAQSPHLDPDQPWYTSNSATAHLHESEGALSFRLPWSGYSSAMSNGEAKPKQVFSYFWDQFVRRLEQ